MNMANFLLPESTSDSHVNNEALVDPDVAAVGSIAVRRGPIGDIAAGDVVVVTATRSHREAISKQLDRAGLDLKVADSPLTKELLSKVVGR